MDYNSVKENLNNYLLARIPFIIFNTVEKERVIKMLGEINASANQSIYIHSMSKGMYDLNGGSVISNDKTLMGILSFISEDLKEKRNVTYVLTDISELGTDTLVARFLCDLVSSAEEKSSSIIILTDQSVWPNLKRLGMIVELDYPNEDEILQLLHRFLDKYRGQINLTWTEDNFKEASVVLLGLSEAEIKNVVSVLIARQSITEEDLIDLKFAKSKMFSNMDGLEKIETGSSEIGGLAGLKSWLAERRKLFSVGSKEDLEKRGIKQPRGVLIVGVPGCGKSLTAKAIAQSWNLPLYLLDFAMVQGMYVGQSEEQLKQALKTAEQVSPCVLWIDEIEKGLSGGSDSSGVTSRMVGQFLFWLQECKKEVFVVATANDVSKLPAELLRKGRFDEIFFVDLPNINERKDIISLYMAKYLHIKLDDAYLNELGALTEGFASSDIEATIRDISYKVVGENIQITKELITDFIKNSTCLMKTNPEKIESIRKWGETRAKKAS